MKYAWNWTVAIFVILAGICGVLQSNRPWYLTVISVANIFLSGVLSGVLVMKMKRGDD